MVLGAVGLQRRRDPGAGVGADGAANRRPTIFPGRRIPRHPGGNFVVIMVLTDLVAIGIFLSSGARLARHPSSLRLNLG